MTFIGPQISRLSFHIFKNTTKTIGYLSTLGSGTGVALSALTNKKFNGANHERTGYEI
jgi:hypothetical protein